MKKVLFLLPTHNQKIHPATRHLLQFFSQWASDLELHGLLLEPLSENVRASLRDSGLRFLHHGAGYAWPDLLPPRLAPIVHRFLVDQPMDLVIAVHSPLARDLLASLACKASAPLLSDVVGVSRGPEGQFEFKRPYYGGKVIGLAGSTKSPLFLTIRPNSLDRASGSGTTPEERVANLAAPSLGQKIQEILEGSAGAVDLASASIIVAAGRGAKPESSIELVRSLAHLLNAGFGASRALVDEGFRPHSEQIGQTGKVVNPNLYIACGISGAIQHQVGMRTSKWIVAINKDKNAPIFGLADYGVVADLNEFIPLFMEELKKGL